MTTPAPELVDFVRALARAAAARDVAAARGRTALVTPALDLSRRSAV